MIQHGGDDRYRALLRVLPQGVMVCGADGVIVEANEAAARIVGADLDELTGLNAREENWPVWDEDGSDLPWEKRPFAVTLRTGEPVRDFVFAIRRVDDGERRWIRASTEPIFSDDGNVVAAVAAITDITRQHAERRERQQREHLGAVLQSSPAAIVTVDMDGHVISWSRAAEELFGWAEEEVIGEFNPILAKERVEPFRQLIQDVAADGRSRLVSTHSRCRDGSLRPVEVSVGPLMDAEGNVRGAVGVHRDVSARLEAEMRLRESRTRYRGLFEHLPVGISEFDFSELRPVVERLDLNSPQQFEEYFARRSDVLEECIDGMCLVDANPAALNLHDASSVEELAERLPEIFGRGGAEGVGRGIALLASGWTVFDLPLPLRTLGGETLQTLVRLQVVPGHETDLARVIVTTIDISNLAEAREELQRTNNLLEATLAGMDQAVVVTDAHRRIISCNEATEAIFGHAPDDLVGQSTRCFHHSDEQFEAFGRHTRPVLTDGRTHRTEMTLVRADDSEFLAEVITSPLDRSEGWLGGTVSVVRDVTESRKLQERLAQSRRLEAVGQLAGGVAHDFNNMLTVIVGNLGMALRNVQDAGAVHEQVSQSLEAARRTTKLTNQLLAFSRKQVLAPETLDLDHAVEELARLLSRTIPESIELQARCNGGAPVYFDPAQVDQIVMNLVVNARDAMPDGGVLTIATDGVTVSDGDANPAELSPGNYVRLSVSDTGLGMDEQTRRHVFEPFFSTREGGSGTGLGLATVYGIATQGGGGVEVSSTPGEGSRFDVYLPIATDAPKEVTVKKRRSPPAVTGETVLVAEDDAAVRRLVVSVLQGRGYDVLAACSGADARRVFADHGGEIELLVTDVVMPGMSGTELARRLRGERPNLPVLYISGYTGDVIDNHGLDQDGARLLSKPFGPDDLLREVKWVLGRANG